jgi:hypothetical protein
MKKIDMAKYYIVSYKKRKMSFSQRINTMDDLGNIYDIYDVELEKVYFFGLLKKKVFHELRAFTTFNAEKHLIKGREYEKPKKVTLSKYSQYIN